jgi:hypothetical protein
MTWSIKAEGHITAGDQSADVERALAADVAAVLAKPEYGCTSSRISGNHISGSIGDPKAKPAEPSLTRMGEHPGGQDGIQVQSV